MILCAFKKFQAEVHLMRWNFCLLFYFGADLLKLIRFEIGFDRGWYKEITHYEYGKEVVRKVIDLEILTDKLNHPEVKRNIWRINLNIGSFYITVYN